MPSHITERKITLSNKVKKTQEVMQEKSEKSNRNFKAIDAAVGSRGGSRMNNVGRGHSTIR